jgi:hypothetical protein
LRKIGYLGWIAILERRIDPDERSAAS